jgi:hypothetical protein
VGAGLTETWVGDVLELDRPDLPWAENYTVLILERASSSWRVLVLQGGSNDTYEAGDVTHFSEHTLFKNFKRIG